MDLEPRAFTRKLRRGYREDLTCKQHHITKVELMTWTYKIGVSIRDDEKEVEHHFEHESSKELLLSELPLDETVMQKVRYLVPAKQHLASYGIRFLYITN